LAKTAPTGHFDQKILSKTTFPILSFHSILIKKSIERTLMRRRFISALLAVSLLSQPLAAMDIDWTWRGDTPVVENGSSCDFSDIYPRAFYEKDYFVWASLVATAVVAGAVSYYTAGAGAPAAATWVSSVASYVGGGGAGSYMAGLSTIGGLVGGNAMVGAAILNGISIATIGSGTAKGLSLATKVALMMDATLSGISMLRAADDTNLYYSFDIPLPEKIGHGEAGKWLELIHENETERREAIEAKDALKAKRLAQLIQDRYAYAMRYLDEELSKPLPLRSNENLLALAIIAYRIGDIARFTTSLDALDRSLPEGKKGFFYYLRGIASLSETSPDTKSAKKWFEKASQASPYALEPYLARIVLLAQDMEKNGERIEALGEYAIERYDADEYAARISPLALHFKIGTLFLHQGQYDKAVTYFRRAYDDLGWFARYLPVAGSLKNQLRIYEALAMKRAGDVTHADRLFDDILKSTESDEEAAHYKIVYEGSSHAF
jgi:tetratricopeptide (TPR) repeat protein